jgi:hypothetical protein
MALTEIKVDKSTRIKQAMEFPMQNIIQRYCKDEGISIEVALQHEKELKRYLVVCAINRAGYEMTGPVDKLWHTFLLFTREYAQFCDTVAGYFIHHVPKEEQAQKSGSYSSTNSYKRFLEEYEVIFHEQPPAHVWPFTTTSTFLDSDCDTRAPSDTSTTTSTFLDSDCDTRAPSDTSTN